MATRVILPGLLEITTTMGDNRLALYLLHDQLTLLVDSGLRDDPERVIFPALLAAGLSDQIDLLLISHADADHHGGNGAILARSPGTKILCHRLDMARVCSRERHLRERYTAAVAADDTPFAPELLDWLEANIGPDARCISGWLVARKSTSAQATPGWSSTLQGILTGTSPSGMSEHGC